MKTANLSHFPASPYEDVILGCMRFIDANYMRDLSSDDLARYCSMSRVTFSEQFRRVSGTTPHRYILKKRIEAAQELLAHTFMPVLDISYHVGFGDVSTFHRNFRKFCGCTPREYRTVQLGKE